MKVSSVAAAAAPVVAKRAGLAPARVAAPVALPSFVAEAKKSVGECLVFLEGALGNASRGGRERYQKERG
jgi:hypothetical protein